MVTTIRTLCQADLDAVVPLLEGAYRRAAAYRERVARYLAIEPQGWFVLEDGGALVGMVGVVTHESVAYVGLMAVAPEQQGKGFARRLMDHALAWTAARGIGSVMLDASDAGRPLYLRSGFEPRGKSLDLVYEGPKVHANAETLAVDEVLALDRAQFGADRQRTLRAFAERGRVVGVRARGRVVAYAIGQRALIGPVVAEDDAAARDVLAAALTLPFEAPPRVLAPESQHDLLASVGFRSTRALEHMRRGPEIPYRIVAKASFAVG